jgi:hypothetical protein
MGHGESRGHNMRIVVDEEITAEELADLQAILDDSEIDATVEAAYGRKGIGDFPWIALIQDVPWKDFLLMFGGFVAQDVYDGSKNRIRRFWLARKKRDGNFVVMDPDSGNQVVIPGDLDDAAYEKLGDVNPMEAGESGQIGFDPQSGDWVPPF